MINNDIYLIDDGYVKDNSKIMQNVEAQSFSEYILIAQNIQLQEAIGSDLYEVIITQFTDYQTALETDPNADINNYVEARILTLVDNYFQIILLYYTLYHASYSFKVKYTNKGPEQQKSEYSVIPSDKTIENQRAQWKSYAEKYMLELINYLVDNLDTYPEYISDCDTTQNKRGNNTGMYLGSSI